MADESNIINIFEHKAHLSGDAKCLGCQHEWQAVAPVGTTELECPGCGLWKGVYACMTAPDTVWQCDCGNQHFYIDDEGAICARCGVRAIF